MAGKGEGAAKLVPDIVTCIYEFTFVFKTNKKTLPKSKTSFLTHFFTLVIMKE